MNDYLLYDYELLVNVSEYNKKRYFSHLNGEYFPENIEYERILKARYQKSSRIKRRMVYLFSRCNYIWFCTFTFSDKYINKTTRTKRDLIKSVLNFKDFKYILNVDYGKSTQREHYHCLLGTNENIDINEMFQFSYIGGFSKSILCKNGIDDFTRLRKYIDKLVNHCIKASTTRQRLVYNFKGYDIITPSHDASMMYYFDYRTLFCKTENSLYKLLNDID